MLAEQGKLSFEDRLLAYFPQFPHGAQRLPFAICCTTHRVCRNIFISLAPVNGSPNSPAI
jgi:hypothetical protein